MQNDHNRTTSLRKRLLTAAASAVIAGAVGFGAVTSGVLPVYAEAVRVETNQTMSFADVVEKVTPAVVSVRVESRIEPVSERGSDRFSFEFPGLEDLPRDHPMQRFFREFWGDRGMEGDRRLERDRARPEGRRHFRQRPTSQGSGFFVSADGYVVTNNHVVAGGQTFTVVHEDGTEYEARLVGTDERTDLAVLKIDDDREFTYVAFADDTAVRVGDWVVAVGNPFGLGGTVTAGIVSAVARDIQAGPYDDFIQTDAAINRGNSGGPLFDMHGRVIGINTAIISPSGGSIGIGFSIPSQLAVGVIDQLREFGETRRGWLGVRIQPVTDDIAESLGMNRARGALIAGVIRGGPVDDGTIQPGDVIIRFDGKEVRTMRDLPRLVAETSVGKEVEIVVIRKGEEHTVAVTLGRLEDGQQLAEGGETTDAPENGAPVATATVLGMTIAELDEATRAEFEISEDISGVLVTEVEEGSLAAERGVGAGDVITEIAQESVSSPKDVTDRIAALKNQGRRNALLMLASRTGELRFVTIRMD
jgi:serine protease Do